MDGQINRYIYKRRMTHKTQTEHGTKTIIKSSSRRLGTAFSRQLTCISRRKTANRIFYHKVYICQRHFIFNESVMSLVKVISGAFIMCLLLFKVGLCKSVQFKYNSSRWENNIFSIFEGKRFDNLIRFWGMANYICYT